MVTGCPRMQNFKIPLLTTKDLWLENWPKYLFSDSLVRCDPNFLSNVMSNTTTSTATSISAILAASPSGYMLKIFTSKEIASLEITQKRGKPYLKCHATGKDRPAKPEEIVRQLYLHKLIHEYGYPTDRIAVEKGVYFGSSMHEKRADIVIFEQDAPNTPYIIVECKKPKRKDGLEQLKSYCNAEGSPIGVWTNGGEALFLHREEPNLFKNLPDIPRADQKLSDLLSERWDMKRLSKENRLVKELLTLRDIILDMEDLVLANAGVDAFEEVFKLIYAKLYDEWKASRPSKKTKYLEFRIYGSTAHELQERISVYSLITPKSSGLEYSLQMNASNWNLITLLPAYRFSKTSNFSILTSRLSTKLSST